MTVTIYICKCLQRNFYAFDKVLRPFEDEFTFNNNNADSCVVVVVELLVKEIREVLPPYLLLRPSNVVSIVVFRY